jgi:aspartokinase/homoserine dehydrogenase 1
MRQLHEQQAALRETFGIDLKLQGLANSRTMLLSGGQSKPIAFSEQELSVGAPFVLEQFVSHLISANLSNCIFVDCTASDDVPRIYPRLLERSIAVVTPNKRGISADMQFYSTLKNAAKKRRTPFLHETCVGAALPVVNTLADLVRSGDRVVQIEAVLSGTLSFVFNSMADGVSFSAAVLEAKARGYTEPDPRDDLSGMDVARKALILAREAGLTLELEQITRHPLLPQEALTWSLEEFLTKLPSLDRHFESQVQAARKRDGRLACGALIDCTNGRVEVGLRTVSLEHPFASLKGSDNLVAFTTRRYASQPLVVKGPGAGAEVTAAGVFADIIRIAR